MGKRITWVFVALLMWMPTAATAESVQAPQGSGQAPAGRQNDHRRKWWVDDKSRAELGITAQQSADIEQIWQSTFPKQRAAKQELDQLEETLSATIKANTADVAAVAQQVERVENLRADMAKTRTVMLYRINRVLTPDQRVRLKAMHDRWESRRKDTDKIGRR